MRYGTKASPEHEECQGYRDDFEEGKTRLYQFHSLDSEYNNINA
jgi:hypothetical protein